MALPLLSGTEVVRVLGRAGFTQTRQTGSHVSLTNGEGRVTIVPIHKEVARGTLRSILRQANLTETEFRALMQ